MSEYELSDKQKRRIILGVTDREHFFSRLKHADKRKALIFKGYKYVYAPYCGYKTHIGWIAEHRLVAQITLGRSLRIGEVVHHKDRNKLNNSPENLQVMFEQAHNRLHSMPEHVTDPYDGKIKKKGKGRKKKKRGMLHPHKKTKSEKIIIRKKNHADKVKYIESLVSKYS